MKAKTGSGYTTRDLAIIAAGMLILVPFVAVRFFDVGIGSPFLVAAVTGIAIVAAAFFLSWAVEGLETVMSQALALVILVLIEVAPEFAFEAVLAWRQQIDLLAASVTGVIRLLLGLGWPLVALVAYVSARRKRRQFAGVELAPRQSLELLYLLIAASYGLVIPLKRTLSIVDSVVLSAVYALYLYSALRSHTGAKEEEQAAEGIGGRTKQLRGLAKWAVISAFLSYGAFVIYVGTEPFIDAVLQVAKALGVSEFLLIQWIAPLLSEIPESLTAYLFAATVVFAGIGLRNLIASKLTQWTLLFAAIPIVYAVSVGEVRAVQLTSQSVQEIFLAAARSVFSVVLLLDLRFGLKKAFLFVALFAVEFLLPLRGVHVTLGWVYLTVAALYVAFYWRKLRALRQVLPWGRSAASEEA